MKPINSIISLLFVLTSFFFGLKGYGLSYVKEQAKVDSTRVVDYPEVIRKLISDAEIAMRLPLFSVTQNEVTPPSGDKHDYYSWSPYLWPNPATADGFPYIVRDGETNKETEKLSDKTLIRQMSTAVNILTLAYKSTGNAKYAEKAAKLVRTWFINNQTRMNPNLNFAQCVPGEKNGNFWGIIDTRWLIMVVDVLPILEESRFIKANEALKLHEWFNMYIEWLLRSEQGQSAANAENNHASWYSAQLAKYSMYTNNHKLAMYVVNRCKLFFNQQIDSIGRQLHELHRTKSYDYSLYNLHALITLAQIAERFDIDLWNHNKENGKNIFNSIKYLAEFYNSNKPWPYQQIEKESIALDYADGLHFSVYYPYDLYYALNIGSQVYDEPFFRECIIKIESEYDVFNRFKIVNKK